MRISDWSSDVCSSDLSSSTTSPRREEERIEKGRTQEHSHGKDNDERPDRATRPQPARQTKGATQDAPPRLALSPHRQRRRQTGRAPCREGVCQSVSIAVVAVPLKNKKKKKTQD